MKTFTIVIPTTEHLVGVTDITVENPMVSSVVCVNNKLEALPISNQYNEFVKSPTGIIEKITGNSSYRIDLTNKIDHGNSWQLGLTIAHILHDNKKIDFSEEKNLISNKSSSIIWTTGLINSNLSIKPVDFLEKKFSIAIDFFKECIKKNIEINIVLSKESKDEFKKIIANNSFITNALHNKIIYIIYINNLNDLLIKLNLNKIQNSKNIDRKLFPRIKHQIKWVSFIFLFGLFSFLFNNIWNVMDPLYKLNNNNDFRALLTSLSSYRQGDLSKRFAAYIFDYFQTIEVKNLNKQIVLNFIPYSQKNDLNLKKNCLKNKSLFNKNCQLNIELTNIGDDKVFLWMLNIEKRNIEDKKTDKSKIKHQIINGLIPSKETISIDIKNNENTSVLFFVYGKKFDVNIRKWLLNLSKGNALLTSTANRIKSLGFGYQIKEVQNVKFIKNIM